MEVGALPTFIKTPETKKIYQLSYIKGCDTVITERTLYFINNKIVLAIISDGGKNRTTFYRNDKHLNVDGLSLVPEKLADKVLINGYEVLKDFK